jgi:tetratricopeptide (TPR) repeat protein
LPQIGLCLALVWGVADLCRDWPDRRWVCGVGAALALVVLMACAWRQTTYWRNSVTLWTRTLACTSDNYKVHNLLGSALALRGRTDEAVVQFQAALEIKPNYPDAHYSLGVAAADRGRIDEAMAHYRKALAANPASLYYSSAHNNLGVILLGRGQFDEAIEHFQEALTAKSDLAEAYYNLGNALFAVGRVSEALAEYEKALANRDDYAEAHYNLGIALEACGRRDAAVPHYRKAAEILRAKSQGPAKQ